MTKRGPWTTLKEEIRYETPWIRVTHHDILDPSGREGIYGTVHFKNLAIGVVPLDDELNTWIAITRSVFYNSNNEGKNVLVALKADGNTNYSKVSLVIRTFQAQQPPVSRFKMITDLEKSRM